MPKLGESQDRAHPWFKKSQNAAQDKAIKMDGVTPRVRREPLGCPHCGSRHCYFGECDGREL